MNVELPAFMQCTACEVAYTSGRFCPTCDNKLAAVDQTTFPVVGLPPASPVEEDAPVDSDDEVIWDSARARPPAEIEAEALRMDATAAAEAHQQYLIGIAIAFDGDSDSD